MKKSELLAPAGNFERMEYAFAYGADAVYFGGQDFSMRANANNFNLEEIKKAVKFAHSLNKKVYVTVNIVFHEEDINGLEEYLRYLDSINVDAIIISDPIIINIKKNNKLKLNLFLSTQDSCLNHETAKFWKEEGINRIVLARECDIKSIKYIKDNVDIELETFIHGAMCTFFSGQCMLSNYLTSRDANRGGCAQICRWNLLSDYSEPFSMMSKDLNTVKFIKNLMEIGVDSFKIEGRMRSIYYVATVCYIYRQLIDKIHTNSLTDEYTNYYLNILNRCANRDTAPQFFDKLPGASEQYFTSSDEVSNQDFLGIIKSYDSKKKQIVLEQRNYFKIGDIVQIFGPNTKSFDLVIEKILDEDDKTIEFANHPKMIVKIPCEIPVFPMDIMRVKIFDNLTSL